MCIFLVKTLRGGQKTEKIDMPGGPNAKMPNFFFHLEHERPNVNMNKNTIKNKKYNALLKRGILLTHRNFAKKPRPKRGG